MAVAGLTIPRRAQRRTGRMRTPRCESRGCDLKGRGRHDSRLGMDLVSDIRAAKIMAKGASKAGRIVSCDRIRRIEAMPEQRRERVVVRSDLVDALQALDFRDDAGRIGRTQIMGEKAVDRFRAKREAPVVL